MYFPTKYLHPTPNHPKTPFWGTVQCKVYYHGALRKSHVNGTTNLKLYSYINIGKYFGGWVCQHFSARGRPWGAGPPTVNLGPPIISETTRARKLKFKTRGLRVWHFCYPTRTRTRWCLPVPDPDQKLLPDPRVYPHLTRKYWDPLCSISLITVVGWHWVAACTITFQNSFETPVNSFNAWISSD